MFDDEEDVSMGLLFEVDFCVDILKAVDHSSKFGRWVPVNSTLAATVSKHKWRLQTLVWRRMVCLVLVETIEGK